MKMSFDGLNYDNYFNIHYQIKIEAIYFMGIFYLLFILFILKLRTTIKELVK